MENEMNRKMTYATEADPVLLEALRAQAAELAGQLCDAAHLHEGSLVVVGCSTSEILGERIGTDSNLAAATAVFDGLQSVFTTRGVRLIAQCCEHLNRALIAEREAVPGVDPVNVVPQPKAGGSFATAAYRAFRDPVAVEAVRADAGLDLGGTLIGMHLKPVAVPLRLPRRQLGQAIVIAARTRPKFVGGSRAVYDESLL